MARREKAMVREPAPGIDRKAAALVGATGLVGLLAGVLVGSVLAAMLFANVGILWGASRWVALSWLRNAQDVTTALLLAAAVIPIDRQSS